MSRAANLRSLPAAAGLLELTMLIVLASPGLIHAQSSPGNSADTQGQTAPLSAPALANTATGGSGSAAATKPAIAGAVSGSGSGLASDGSPASPAIPWNQSLLDAFQPNGGPGRFLGLADPTGTRVVLTAAGRGTGVRFGGRPQGKPKPVIPNLNQLTRQGMNLRFNSPAGSFRLTYREVFGPRTNALGGGMGMGTAAATYTTSNVGGTLVNFSAAAFMGGPPTTAMTGGFYNNSLWTAGTQKHPAPTLSVRLTF
jgi:hypothetical protein